MRKHTWTIITDEPNEPQLGSILPGKNSLVSQPDGTILRTYVTYDPITEEQALLIKQHPATRPEGIRGLSVSSLDVADMVDPKKMTTKEREYLVETFKGIVQQFQTIEHQLIALQDLYPGLDLVSISLHARQGQEEGEELSEYIQVAHNMHWKQEG